MRDWGNEAGRFIDQHIDVWGRRPSFRALAEVAEENRAFLSSRISEIFKRRRKSYRAKADEARDFLVRYVIERVRAGIEVRHFTLFKEYETVEVVLEDAFGVDPGPDSDRVIIPYQAEAVTMIARCLFPKRIKAPEARDIAVFMQMFCDPDEKPPVDQDKQMRVKTMVWLAYLLIDLVKTDRQNVCFHGTVYLRESLKNLLVRAVDGKIINEDSEHSRDNYEEGRWDGTLYGWLQGEDRKPFLEKLLRQFNLENRSDHVNRFLLAGQRECMYRQTMALFC